MCPSEVGNERRVLVSELSGKSNIIYKAVERGLRIDESAPDAKVVVEKLKEMEHDGYQFEGAEGSFELLFDKLVHHSKEFFELDGGGSHQVARGRQGRAYGGGRGWPGERPG